MKVLLVNPKDNVWSGGTSTLPLGLAYLASYLIQSGHAVTCIDLEIDPLSSFESALGGCDLVGITACTPTIKKAWDLAKLAKLQGKRVVLGGPHPTVMPEESLENDFVDIVVIGEGEETLKQVCSGIPLDKIDGIAFKQDGRIIRTTKRALISPLDSLQFPARQLFKYKAYKSEFHKKETVANILTSRGCPCLCNFCSRTIFGNTYRMRTPENVFEEWAQMLKMGIEEIHINDDNFTAIPKRAIQICEMISSGGLSVPWTASGGLRVDRVTKEVLEAMKKSGCYRVSLGAESGSQEILDKTGKNIKIQQIRDAVRMCKETGLEILTFFMIGNLGETEETIQQTIDFAKELEPDFVQFTVAVPYPGTELHEYVLQHGKLLIKDWSDYSSYAGKAYFECDTITKELIEKMFKSAYRQYYLRPGIALKMLFRYNFKLLKGFSLIK